MDTAVSRLTGPGRVVRAAAANALADFRATYSWYSWTFGWLGRMLCQVTFFALLGSFLHSADQARYLVLGNSVMTCVIEAMTVVVSTSWERGQGTLALLAAAPSEMGWVFLGRSLQWPLSGCGTSLVALLLLDPLFGVHFTATQVPVLVALVLLTAFSTYCFGLFLGAFVLAAPAVRNFVYNAAYLVTMAISGVQVPTGFWPLPVRLLAEALPATHGVAAVRALADGSDPAACARQAALAVVTGALWLAAALTAFRQSARWVRRRGGYEFAP
ncbi:ABC transporter permease [Streptomyces sp. DSM 41527]|uniref:ABC transporter permease n=1 Tax=Streptomyces mooreae TaxID=3075523 RepID=A0ABU2T5T1_9ACTN|nr:ABC transporter permease [Streptomyces sp. DSM 41527]MDT0456457.1 ABC transporter permease [Streptomyces sp. DSM 41527]